MTEFQRGDRVWLPGWGPGEYVQAEAVADGVIFGWHNCPSGSVWPDALFITDMVALVQAPVKRYIVEHRPPRKGDRYLSYVCDVREVLADWAQPAPVIIEELS